MLFDYFHNGINLGGWLSQWNCVVPAPTNEEERSEHFKTFITEENIAQIASLGIDHIRLPIDAEVLECKDNPRQMREEAFYYLDMCACWCEKYGLNLILDLHHVAGNVWGMMDEPMPLLTEFEYQKRFLNIWEAITIHFKGRLSPIIMFELLNEVSDGSGYLWNRLYKEAILVIRKIDSNRMILVGSNGQNSAFYLKQLELLDDSNVFYNFHFYDPQVFTHQRAHFSKEMMTFDQSIPYPGDISDFTKFLLEHTEYLEKYRHVAMEKKVDRKLTLRLIKDAIDFVTYSGHQLYCGEFGVINSASPYDAANWIKDCMEIFETYQIGFALWNYKTLDFGIVDKSNQFVSKELVDIIYNQR